MLPSIQCAGALSSAPHRAVAALARCPPPSPLHPQESFKTEDDGWVIRDGVVVIIKDSNIPDGTII